MSDQIPVTDRTRVRRLPARGRYDRAGVNDILDEGFVAHVGICVDGSPRAIPIAYACVGDHLYLHGAVANHLLRSLADGAEACVTVTLVDGLVLARSHFHHSINYRSVMIFGHAEPVTDPDEKREVLRAVVDHVVAGRADDSRAPNDAELRATLVVKLPIDEVSAKVRTGPPIDDADDMGLDVWAGELPLELTASDPVPAPELDPGRAADVPDYLRDYVRGGDGEDGVS